MVNPPFQIVFYEKRYGIMDIKSAKLFHILKDLTQTKHEVLLLIG